MALFEWKNGTKVQNAVVTSDGTTVQDAVWEGETPISANNMNQAQKKIQDEYNALVGDLSKLLTKEKNNLVDSINELTTDYIIESGSNANGYYEKYANGTLKQWGKAIVTAELKTAHGQLYRTASEQILNFPIPFVGDMPVLNLTAQAALNFAYVATIGLDKSSFYPMTTVLTNANTRYVHWTAEGKWK